MQNKAGSSAVLCLTLIIAGCLEVSSAQSQSTGGPQLLSPPSATAVFPLQIDQGPRSPAYFDNGYFIQVARGFHDLSSPNVFISPKSGKARRELSLAPPGALSVIITSADVAVSGTLIVSGAARMSTGSVKNFIARSDVLGANPNFIYTGSYFPILALMGSDGNIWAIGRNNPNLTPNDPSTVSDALREFSQTGQLLGHWLSLDDLSGGKPGHPKKLGNDLYLRASYDGIVFYDPSSGFLATHANDGTGVSVSTVPLPGLSASELVTGFAVTGDGEVYISIADRTQNTRVTTSLYQLLGAGGPSPTWSSVALVGSYFTRPSDKRECSFRLLLGADGTDLVYRVDEGTIYSTMVLWSPVK